ncbi:NAD(P)-binding protein [Apiospora arundinis]
MVLYGSNPEDYQISLDFDNSMETDFREFESSMHYILYDEVLQYVHLPTVTWTNKKARKRRGREDAAKIFTWLRETKKVRRVVKVTVEDYKEPAHSDSAIVEALAGLRVEALHWLKMDLDPFTILRVGQDVREVRLRWSGSNTALRAWGDPCGLRQLEHLERVFLDLIQEENLEDYETTEANVAPFRRRLNQTAHLEVDENNLGIPMQGAPRDTGTPPTTGTPRQDTQGRPFEYIEPVIVALIDDGVSMLELKSTFGDIQMTGKSLSYGQVGYERNFNFGESTNGHGTVMAHMIYQVCPMVKLYVIRMEHRRSENGMEATIDPDSAADAVKAAVEKKVNIISMSWTVSKNCSDRLRKHITRAHDANILMFASSCDGGHFRDDTWPVAIHRDWFFRIGAATAEGMPFRWAGSADDLDYILPGVDVAKENPKTRPKKESQYGETLASMRPETGSSVATALAAGTAAMLLTCVKMAVVTEKARESVPAELQKREHMATMLNRLHKTENNKFLAVWDTFDTSSWVMTTVRKSEDGKTRTETVTEFDDSTDEQKLDFVAEKIRSLIP